MDNNEFKLTRPAVFGRWQDWFSLWSIYEPAAQLLAQQVQSFNLRDHVAASMAAGGLFEESATARYELHDGIAIIPVQGTITKAQSSLGGASTVGIRKSIRAAQADAKVQGILLAVDSPGGTVAGTPDAADEIFGSRQKKPIWSHIEDLGASASYYLASQAQRVIGNSAALVGSIGVFTVVRDTSKMADEIGVKIHVIRAGEFKGIGTPGTEVTDAQLAELQRVVNEQYAMFINAVMRGMGMDRAKVEALADGSVHVGENALAKGLVHSVASLDQTISDFRQHLGKSKPQGKGFSMSTETPAGPRAATLNELEALCVGASSDFLLAQLKVNATGEAAQKAFCATLQSTIATLQGTVATLTKERDEATAKLKTFEDNLASAPAKPKGATPTITTKAKEGDEEGTATARWDAAVAAEIAKGKTRPQAFAFLARKQPELREAMVAEANATRA